MAEDVNHRDPCVASDWSRRHANAETGLTWIDSRSIFAGKDEVLIKHGDQVYRLRITRHGKLILNK